MGRPNDAVFRFLDTNGDGTGTTNATGDYSITPEEVYFEAAVNCDIHRLIIHIGDTGGIQAQDYGNIAGGLTNGYTVKALDASQAELIDLCAGIPILTNGDIGRYCYDVDLKTWGSGDEFIQARWTFSKAGSPLHLPKGYRLSVTLNDDFTGLLQHYFMVQGYAS